jgi:hypothetical protein
MDQPLTPSLELLFEQLGVDLQGQSIDDFIEDHTLPDGVKLSEADFWTDRQKTFLKEALHRDDDWAPIVDELNTRLHPKPQMGNQA